MLFLAVVCLLAKVSLTAPQSERGSRSNPSTASHLGPRVVFGLKRLVESMITDIETPKLVFNNLIYYNTFLSALSSTIFTFFFVPFLFKGDAALISYCHVFLLVYLVQFHSHVKKV